MSGTGCIYLIVTKHKFPASPTPIPMAKL